MREVRVDLKENGYAIWIGTSLEAGLAEALAGRKFSRRALVVSDANVVRLYGARVLATLREAGLDPALHAVAPGEASKSLETAQTLYTAAIEGGLDRNSLIFALGGGIVGDLAGFVAATYMRGVPFVQLPTSLLAQVDSSVGGKVAVNHPLGKNLIGAFYQPQAVVMDLTALRTLPPRELAAGLAEIVKYGVIYDAAFFDALEADAARILALEADALERVVARSCEIKAAVVRCDERETGLRMILNFGHTIAHAIETDSRYRYNHGEAVAIGMHGAALLSQRLGWISAEAAERIKALLTLFHLPLCAEGCNPARLFRILFRDKKVVDGAIRWVLARRVGAVEMTADVPHALVQETLDAIAR